MNHNFLQNDMLSSELRPEVELLVQLSRLNLVPETLRIVKEIIDSRIDWKLFLEEARRHRLLGLIYHHFLTNNLRLPSQVIGTLSESAIRNQERANIWFQEIEQISNVLVDFDASVVVLKGPALIHQVYESSLIRPFSDIDLLTFTEVVQNVEKTLCKLGYVQVSYNRKTKEYVPMTPLEIELYPGVHRPIMMRQKALSPIKFSIDLHHTGLGVGKVDYRSIINNSKPLYESRKGLWVPSLEDLIILSAWHFYNNTVDSFRRQSYRNSVGIGTRDGFSPKSGQDRRWR